MASVINRTTKQYFPSVNTPDYNIIEWIINPDISAVQGVPVKYWKIVGDVVSEMSQVEKDAYDAANPPMASPPSDLVLYTESDSDLTTTSNSPVSLHSAGLTSTSNATFMCVAEGNIYVSSATVSLELRVNGNVVNSRIKRPRGYMPYTIIRILPLLVGDVVTLTLRRISSRGTINVYTRSLTLKKV